MYLKQLACLKSPKKTKKSLKVCFISFTQTISNIKSIRFNLAASFGCFMQLDKRELKEDIGFDAVSAGNILVFKNGYNKGNNSNKWNIDSIN